MFFPDEIKKAPNSKMLGVSNFIKRHSFLTKEHNILMKIIRHQSILVHDPMISRSITRRQYLYLFRNHISFRSYR